MSFQLFPSRPTFSDDLPGSKLNPKNSNAYQPDLSVRLICPNCKEDPPNLVEEYSAGDLICGSCGLVLGDRIVDTRSEWRTFSNEEGDDPSRVGAATNSLLSDSTTLSTMIASSQIGGSKELQRAALRAGGSTDKNLQTGFAAITQMCDAIHLGNQQREFAKQLYKRVEDEKLLRGKPQEAVQAACIFIACRSGNVGRSLKEISALCSENVKKNKIGQCFQIIEKHLQTTSLPSLTTSSTPVSDTSGTGSNTRNNPEELLIRYCSYLGDPKLESYAREICLKVRERGTLDGRSPISVASSCIYFAAHLLNRMKGKSLRDVSRVTQVTEGTIKICYKLLYADREHLVPEKWFEPTAKVRADLTKLPEA